MIIATWNCKVQHTVLVALFCIVGLQIGNTQGQGDSMKSSDFQVSVDTQPIKFTTPPVLKDDAWLLPLEHFAKQLGLKVEYPEGGKMVVLCGGTESELCVSLRFQDSKNGTIDIDGVTYARPASIAEPFGFQIFKHHQTQWRLSNPHTLPRNSRSPTCRIPQGIYEISAERRPSCMFGDRGEVVVNNCQAGRNFTPNIAKN